MTFPELRPRQPLTGVALAAVIGIASADWWVVDWRALVLVTLSCAAATVWRPRALLCWAVAALGFATLHTLRHHHSENLRLAEQLTSGARTIIAVGTVLNEPEETKANSRSSASRFKLHLESADIDGVTLRFDINVNVRWLGTPPVYGDRVKIRGAADNIASPRNPAQFDFKAYARRLGISSEVAARYASDCQILGHGYGSAVQAFAFKAREWMRTQLAMDLADDPTVAALVASMVLGLRGETPEEIQDMFRTTGTLHLFAVSGLNVAMLAAITWGLLKPLRISRRIAVFVTIPIILFYALITGLSASCVRAAIMGSLVLAGFLFDRPPSLFNSLAAAALLILAWDTNQLFMPGFQFSFVLVMAIAWFSGRVQRRIEPIAMSDEFLPRALWNWQQRVRVLCWKAFAGAMGVTLASWFGSLAFTAGYFHLFSPAAIIANLLAVPLAFGILALGLFAVVAAPFSSWLAILFNNSNWAFAKVLLLTVELFAHMPGGHVYVEVPKGLSSAPVAEITVFDFGQGGAIHLRAGSEDWLIDCGHRFEYQRCVLPYLRSRGVNKLDALVLTHGDAEHIGAATEVWSDLRPGAVFDSALKDRSQTRRMFHKVLAQQQRGKRFLLRGDVAETNGDVKLEVLYPPAGHARALADDKALVLRLSIAGSRILLMSDSGFATERWLMENEPDLSADVLVKGWHSNDLSGTTDFMMKVRPRVVIAGAEGAAGTVDQFVKWCADNTVLFRQKDTGAVQVELWHDGGITVKGILTETVFRGRGLGTSPPQSPHGSAVHD